MPDPEVSAPCGCQKACPEAPKTSLPQKSNCCLVPMPCGNNEPAGCNTKPEAMTEMDASNPLCAHVKFSWKAPKSCEKVTQYQIRVKTNDGSMRELNAIPGSYNEYRVSNPTFMTAPFNLEVGTIIEYEMRAYSSNGWGPWSSASKLPAVNPAAPFQPAKPAAPVATQKPPGGAQCVNSWWNGFQCVGPSGAVAMTPKPFAPAEEEKVEVPVIEKGDNAVVQECARIPVPEPVIKRVSQPQPSG